MSNTESNDPQLHSSIVALISLASGIAAKHPAMGMCQLDKLRSMGIPESQINTAVEIARHIRDEASEKMDAAFDEKAGLVIASTTNEASSDSCCGTSETEPKVTETESCCSSTPSGQSCC